MEGYWEIIAETVRHFSRPGDKLFCADAYQSKEFIKCQLCGHYPIKNIFLLMNERTGESLKVGSECIVNYKVVSERMGGRVYILYPEKFKPLADKLNDRYPGTVTVVDDRPDIEMDLAMRGYKVLDPEDLDIDDLAPEGMGLDDVDWDSYGWDSD